MANVKDIRDERLRGMLEEARERMRAGDPSAAVRGIAEAFLLLLERKPEIRESTVPIRGGRRVALLSRWPALGANLKEGSVEAGKPEIEYVRERFALSEALTYYEFTVETAINHDA